MVLEPFWGFSCITVWVTKNNNTEIISSSCLPETGCSCASTTVGDLQKHPPTNGCSHKITHRYTSVELQALNDMYICGNSGAPKSGHNFYSDLQPCRAHNLHFCTLHTQKDNNLYQWPPSHLFCLKSLRMSAVVIENSWSCWTEGHPGQIGGETGTWTQYSDYSFPRMTSAPIWNGDRPHHWCCHEPHPEAGIRKSSKQYYI